MCCLVGNILLYLVPYPYHGGMEILSVQQVIETFEATSILPFVAVICSNTALLLEIESCLSWAIWTTLLFWKVAICSSNSSSGIETFGEANETCEEVTATFEEMETER